jgi:hypothetical protein
MPKSELFDLARSIDAHKDSMAQSREVAIAGVTSGLISWVRKSHGEPGTSVFRFK